MKVILKEDVDVIKEKIYKKALNGKQEELEKERNRSFIEKSGLRDGRIFFYLFSCIVVFIWFYYSVINYKPIVGEQLIAICSIVSLFVVLLLTCLSCYSGSLQYEKKLYASMKEHYVLNYVSYEECLHHNWIHITKYDKKAREEYQELYSMLLLSKENDRIITHYVFDKDLIVNYVNEEGESKELRCKNYKEIPSSNINDTVLEYKYGQFQLIVPYKRH